MAATLKGNDPIEVVCVDMRCFKVNPVTLEPLSCSYYEPAAWNDPRGPQMSHSEWTKKRMDILMPAIREGSDGQLERNDG